ncbi:MAG: hypothetical protein ACI807_003997, partial [Paracoccaceae bacterium]
PAMVGVAAAGSGADLTDDEGVVENG